MNLITFIINTGFGAFSGIIVILFVMEKLFGINVKELFTKGQKNSFTFNDLEEHPFFNRIKNSLNDLERGGLKIENKYKKYWANKFVPIKFKYFYDEVKERVHKIEDEEDCLEFAKYMSDNLYSMVKEYCQIAKDAGVPVIFIESFEKHHKGTEQTLCSTFKDIVSSRLYYNNIDRVKEILLALEFALMRTYHDLETMFEIMNGDLAGPLEEDAKKRGIII